MTEELIHVLQQLTDETRQIRSIGLTPLSDLRRAQVTEVRGLMNALDPRRRLELVSAMVELAESSVHLNFLAILRESLYDTEAAVRRAAIEGLWEDERPALVAPLARLLSQDPAAEVRSAAATSLGRFVLLGALGEISDTHAQSAEQALRSTWSNGREPVEVRRRALESLAYTDEGGVEELIETAYYDEDDLMRQSAVFAMGRTADRRWARAVLTELGSHDPAMRYEAALSAGELALTSAVKPLVRLLDDTDSTVREAAAAALGSIGGKDAREALNACRHSADRSLAEAATTALEELAFNSDAVEAPLLDDGGEDLAGEDDLAGDDFDEDEADLDDEWAADQDDLAEGDNFADEDDDIDDDIDFDDDLDDVEDDLDGLSDLDDEAADDDENWAEDDED